MSKGLVGPVLADVLRLVEGRHFTLASAFYSTSRLDATTIRAESADFLVRLNLKSLDEWILRLVAPDALLRLWDRHPDTDIRLFASPGAHAKIYAGDSAFAVGSANYTTRGLSGIADEVLWLEDNVAARRAMARTIDTYRSSLTDISKPQLEDYVAKNVDKVLEQQKGIRPAIEAWIPAQPVRPPRHGDYDQFLAWLAYGQGDAAEEILARANGRGQLSGHIRMNFYGLRQFLLANPSLAAKLRKIDPDHYRFLADASTVGEMRTFVANEATDEGGLRVATWRTYLPMNAGGKPKTGGGTSGNLNRMLPLLARYLKQVQG